MTELILADSPSVLKIRLLTKDDFHLVNIDESNDAKHQLYINKEKAALEHLLHSIKGKSIEIIEREF